MLTKQDLQEIKSIVDTSVETKLEEKLEQTFEQTLTPLYQKIDVVEKKVTSKIDNVDKKLSKKLDRMQKSLDTTISYVDTVTTNHEKRLTTVEQKIEKLPFVTA